MAASRFVRRAPSGVVLEPVVISAHASRDRLRRAGVDLSGDTRDDRAPSAGQPLEALRGVRGSRTNGEIRAGRAAVDRGLVAGRRSASRLRLTSMASRHLPDGARPGLGSRCRPRADRRLRGTLAQLTQCGARVHGSRRRCRRPDGDVLGSCRPERLWRIGYQQPGARRAGAEVDASSSHRRRHDHSQPARQLNAAGSNLTPDLIRARPHVLDKRCRRSGRPHARPVGGRPAEVCRTRAAAGRTQDRSPTQIGSVNEWSIDRRQRERAGPIRPARLDHALSSRSLRSRRRVSGASSLRSQARRRRARVSAGSAARALAAVTAEPNDNARRRTGMINDAGAGRTKRDERNTVQAATSS